MVHTKLLSPIESPPRIVDPLASGYVSNSTISSLRTNTLQSLRTRPSLPSIHHEGLATFKNRVGEGEPARVPPSARSATPVTQAPTQAKKRNNARECTQEGLKHWSRMTTREKHTTKLWRRKQKQFSNSSPSIFQQSENTVLGQLPARPSVPWAPITSKVGSAAAGIIDPYRLILSCFNRDDTIMRAPVQRKGRTESCTSVNDYFSHSGRFLGPVFSATCMLPPLHQNLGVRVEEARVRSLVDTQERYSNMRKAQEKDRQLQAAIKDENQKHVKGNEQEYLQAVITSKATHIFEEVNDWKTFVPPFFHIDDLNIFATEKRVAAPSVADEPPAPPEPPSPGGSLLGRKSRKKQKEEPEHSGILMVEEEKLFKEALSDYASIFCTSPDADTWRIARPTFCRFLIDCDIVDKTNGLAVGNRSRLDLVFACYHFDSFSETHHTFPRQSIRIENIIPLIVILFTALSEQGREHFMQGLLRAQRRVVHVKKELQERAAQECEKDLAIRHKAAEATSGESWPPPPGVTLKEWIAHQEKPAPIAVDALLELELQRLRNELLCRHQLCEPEVIQWVEQFGFLLSNIFDTYRDFSTTTKNGATHGHMSFVGLLRFCLDFGLFPDMVSYEDLLMLYYDIVECYKYVEVPAEDQDPGGHVMKHARADRRGRARRRNAAPTERRYQTVPTVQDRSSPAVGLTISHERRGSSVFKKDAIQFKENKIVRSKSEPAFKFAEYAPLKGTMSSEEQKLAFASKPPGEMTPQEYNVFRLVSNLERWLFYRMGNVKDIFSRIDGDDSADISCEEFTTMLHMMRPAITIDSEDDIQQMFEMIDLDGNGEISLDELDKVIKAIRKTREGGNKNNESVAKGAEKFLKLDDQNFTPIVTPKGFRIFGPEAFIECLLLIAFLRLQKGNSAQTASHIYLKTLWLPTLLHSVFQGHIQKKEASKGHSSHARLEDSIVPHLDKAVERFPDWWSFITHGTQTNLDKCTGCNRVAVLEWGTPSCPQCACRIAINDSPLKAVILGERLDNPQNNDVKVPAPTGTPVKPPRSR